MLINFGLGLIHVGRSSEVGKQFDASITLYWGNRGEVPSDQLPWRRIWRWRWNWLPDRLYAVIGAVVPRPTEHQRLTAAISGKAPNSPRSENCLPAEYERANKSSRWTGRERRLVGLGAWRGEYWSHRSSRRSAMYVYLTGSKERAAPMHHLYVAPAAVIPAAECPSDWKNPDNTPKQFDVQFIHGRASVPDNLGEWLIKSGHCQRSRLIRAGGKGLLGSLASAIAGR